MDRTPDGHRDRSTLDFVRSEWPLTQLDRSVDLAARAQGLRAYRAGNYFVATAAALLMAPSLAHRLFGPGILGPVDHLETVRKILAAGLLRPPDGQSFPETIQRSLRLALTVIRLERWQPAEWGGQGLLDHVILDRGNALLLAATLAPSERPWEEDLEQFFRLDRPSAVAAGRHHIVNSSNGLPY